MKTKPLNRIALLAAALLPALWPTQGRAEDETPKDFGVQIGQRAPAFKLQDQDGNEVSLDSLLKKGPVALVFYRSADWCHFCKFELIHLQRNLPKFEAVGAQLVGISYDPTKALKKFADSREITFPLLSDAGSKTIDAYGVRETVAPGPKEGYSAHASFVLDQKGIVRAKFLDVIYQEQPGVGFLLNALKKAGSDHGNAEKEPAAKPQASNRARESANPDT